MKVDVRPRVALAVVNARTGTFAIRVTTQRALVGKTVDFQRRSQYGQGVTIRRATLRATTNPTVAAARVTVSLPSGTSRVRVFLPRTQVPAGYLAGLSPVRTVTR